MIGYYPEYFGELTGRIYEGNEGPRPGEYFETGEVGAADGPPSTPAPVDPPTGVLGRR